MNKYEKLIEHIINDEDSKARALFHEIVVEKSRDIYESLMDEEQYDENIGGGPQEEMMDEITMDQHGMAEDDDMAMIGDEEPIDGDDSMDMGGDDMGDMGGEGDIEDRVMDLETELDALKAEFEQLMGDEGGEDDSDMDMGDDEGMGDEESMDDEGDEEMGMMESADEEEEVEEDEDEEKVDESRRYKSEIELMREYVEKVTAPSNSSEGHEVGKGGSVSVNKTSITDNMKNDMGGTTANIVKGGSEANPSGTPSNKTGGVLKKGDVIDVAKRNVNVPGGNKGAQNFYNDKAKAKSAEGSTTDGSMSVAKDSILKKIN
jgi:hypothetical protein